MKINIPMIPDPLSEDDDDSYDDEKAAKLRDVNSHQPFSTAEGHYAICRIENNVHSSKLSQLLYPTDTKNKQSPQHKVRYVIVLTVLCHKFLKSTKLQC